MKANIITLIAATLAVAPAIRAQNVLEYGSLTKPSVAATGISKSISQRAEQLSTETSAVTKDTSKGVATQETNVQARASLSRNRLPQRSLSCPTVIALSPAATF